MAFDPAKSIRRFVKSQRQFPFLAGFVAGFYVFLFYYSKNFDLANSWQQLLFFAAYYLAFPSLACGIAYILMQRSRFRSRSVQAVFVVMLSFFAFFLLQHISLPLSFRKALIVVVPFIFLLSFRFRNYKAVMIFIAFMTLFPVYDLGKVMARNASNPTHWNTQPDDILSCRFQKKPNVYYLQVDGYAGAPALKSKLYHFSNSAFDDWLKSRGFTLYDNFRSNYNSTLKSNASCFNMKHHYSRESSLSTDASDYIMGKNPVLEIFARNGYRKLFISERPYLMMSRPDIFYDYTNFTSSELPFLGDGWSFFRDITPDVKRKIMESKSSPSFFLVEKFDPGHIAVSAASSEGVERERDKYLQKLKISNNWLQDVIPFIEATDPEAIIIVGADHSGFVGFNDTSQAFRHITDRDTLNSIFSARMAIRWHGDPCGYDTNLNTSVNLFRILFAYLSGDRKYLDHLQPDISYNNSDEGDLRKIYKAIQ